MKHYEPTNERLGFVVGLTPNDPRREEPMDGVRLCAVCRIDVGLSAESLTLLEQHPVPVYCLACGIERYPNLGRMARLYSPPVES